MPDTNPDAVKRGWILCSVNNDPKYFSTKRAALQSIGPTKVSRIGAGNYLLDVKHTDPDTGDYVEQMALYHNNELAAKDGWKP